MKVDEKLKIFISTKSSRFLNTKRVPVHGRYINNFTRDTSTADILTFQSRSALLQISAYTTQIAKCYVCLKNKDNPAMDEFSWTIKEQKEHINEPIKSGHVYQITLPKPSSTNNNMLTFDLVDGEISFFNSNKQRLIDLKTILETKHWLLFKYTSLEEYLVLGLGENTPPMDKANSSVIMWNTDNSAYEIGTNPLYQSWPVAIFLSPKGYSFGLVFDNPSYSQFKFSNKAKKFDYSVNDTTLAFYFLFGPTLKDVQQQLSFLTGYLPPLPKWALGYQQSRWSYTPSVRLREIASEFRQKNIPCDVLYIDIDYMDHYKCFTWGKDFDDYHSLIHDLHAQGFKIIPIIDPGIKIEQKYSVYDSGIEQDMFISDKNNKSYVTRVWPGRVHFPDFASKSVRSWWSEMVNHFVTDSNVDGIWCDMNEPSTFDPRRTLPNTLIHSVSLTKENQETQLPHERIHNVYGLLMTKATYEGLATVMELPVILTRASYLGGQQYAMTWTGDNKSSWDHLRASIPMLLNLGLSGQPMCGPDIGGFRENCFPKLYERWIIQGAFYPFCRSHTAKGTIDQEPWAFGTDIENIARETLQLRYKLIPYYYSALYSTCVFGGPIMRPLFYEDVDTLTMDPYFYESQFFIGPALLFAPFMDEQGERTYYLPKGKWYNWWTREPLEGKNIYSISDTNKIPLFIRENTIIPLYPTPPAYIAEQSLDTLELMVTVSLTAEVLIPEYFTRNILLGLRCRIVKKEPLSSFIMTLEIEKKGIVPEKYQSPKNLIMNINTYIEAISFQNGTECEYHIDRNEFCPDWTILSLVNITYPLKLIMLYD